MVSLMQKETRHCSAETNVFQEHLQTNQIVINTIGAPLGDIGI